MNPIEYERQQAELGRSELAAQRHERFGDAWLTKEEAEQRERQRVEETMRAWHWTGILEREIEQEQSKIMQAELAINHLRERLGREAAYYHRDIKNAISHIENYLKISRLGLEILQKLLAERESGVCPNCGFPRKEMQ